MQSQPLTLTPLLQKTVTISKQRWARIVGLILAVFVGFGMLYAVLALTVHELDAWNIVTNANIHWYQLIAYFVGLILFVLISSCIQILVATLFLNPNKSLLEDVRLIPEYLSRFVTFTILISLLFILISTPFYAAILFALFDNTLIAVISILVGIGLNIVAATYLFPTPYLMVEKNIYPLEAMRKSISFVHPRASSVALMLVLLAAIIVLIQIITVLAVLIPYVGELLNLLLTIFTIILGTSFVFALYEEVT